MAVNVKKVQAVVRPLEPLVYGGDTLNVQFFEHAYTPRFEEESRTNITSGAGESLIAMTLPLISDWDMLNDYEVWRYEKVGEVDEGYEPPKMSRRFVVNGPNGVLGEWDQQRVDIVDGKTVLYELKPIFKEGKQLLETKTVPITHQGLLDIPLNVLTDIIRAVGKALTPGERTSSSSDSSFG